MKISNFQPIATIKGVKHATIDITYSFFWRTWTETVRIYKTYSYWKFLDSGKYTPEEIVENLEDVYYVKKDLAEYEDDYCGG